MEWRAIVAVVLSVLVLVVWQYVISPMVDRPQQPAQPEFVDKPREQPPLQAPGTTTPTQPAAPRQAGVAAEKPRTPQPQTFSERLQLADFTPSVTQLTVTEREPSGAVRFEYQDPSGWRVVKSLELRYGSYALEQRITIAKPQPGEAPPQDVPAGVEQLVALENDLLRIVMTTRGALIRELFLKKYEAPWSTDPNIVWHWAYFWGPSPPPVTSRRRVGAVNLIAASAETLPPAVEVTADGRQALLRWGPGLHTDPLGNGSYASHISFVNGERWLDAPKPGQPPLERVGTVQWTAVQNKYFTMAVIPHGDATWSVLHQGAAAEEHAVGLRWALDQAVTEKRFSVYVGPKELQRLSIIQVQGKSLAELVYFNYGWVRVIRPDVWLLGPLQWLYRATHNYGIAIIIITAIIKLLFYPLTMRSFKSMQAMQHLQPQMKRLQDMYKQDRQKLNEEMMKLYREQKVNPLGGCLPMVVQIPVFISLYQVLYTQIELRHAVFGWWIKDLSAPDHPMAILMGASMVIQQWMTPTTGDPRQAKMMLFMPIIFTFMFLNFPVGLVIYWLVNNVLTIAQQYVMLRMNRPT